MNRTIVALSTPAAHSAIAVVRLSGEDAVAVASAVFCARSGRPLAALAGYHAAYGAFYADGEQLDDGVALVFRAPKSYTGEDMVELSCHGNPLLARRIVAACVAAGAAPAGAGEFTRRAFENGKLDLSAAEAVAELIEAESDRAARAAAARRGGAVGRQIERVEQDLCYAAAQLAVWSDFPEEEDAPVLTAKTLEDALERARQSLSELAAGYRAGKLIQNGITVAIAGRPNVGKSTLMNLLTGSERSIVTEIPGTTRDVVEGTAQLEGIALRLLDTAGIRDTEDPIERIGVGRAREAVERADLALLVIDRSLPLSPEDEALLSLVRARPHVVALNKTDLPPVVFQQHVENCVEISAATGEGGDALRRAILDALGLAQTQDGCFIASERQFDCVLRAQSALSEALDALRQGVTLDAVGVLLDAAVAPLAELTGRSVTQAVLEQVFSKFCVGK